MPISDTYTMTSFFLQQQKEPGNAGLELGI